MEEKYFSCEGYELAVNLSKKAEDLKEKMNNRRFDGAIVGLDEIIELSTLLIKTAESEYAKIPSNLETKSVCWDVYELAVDVNKKAEDLMKKLNNKHFENATFLLLDELIELLRLLIKTAKRMYAGIIQFYRYEIVVKQREKCKEFKEKTHNKQFDSASFWLLDEIIQLSRALIKLGERQLDFDEGETKQICEKSLSNEKDNYMELMRIWQMILSKF